MRQTSAAAGLAAALAGAALLLSAAAAAQSSPTLYRWVDRDGHVHYGDAPTDPKAKIVDPRVLGNGEDASTGPAPAVVDAKKAECKRKTDEYNRYKTAAGISETDGLGNTHSYTPEEKDKLVERKKQDLVQQCGADTLAPQT